MPRKQLKPRERRGLPDPDWKFGSVLAARMVGRLNFKGQRNTAENIFYGALDIVQQKSGEDPIAVYTRAIENARPLLEVKPRRVGGASSGFSGQGCFGYCPRMSRRTSAQEPCQKAGRFFVVWIGRCAGESR